MADAITRITIQAKDAFSAPAQKMQKVIVDINRALTITARLGARAFNTLTDRMVDGLLKLQSAYRTVDEWQNTLLEKFSGGLAELGIDIDGLISEFSDATKVSFTDITSTIGQTLGVVAGAVGANVGTISAVFNRIPQGLRTSIGRSLNLIDGLIQKTLLSIRKTTQRVDSVLGGASGIFAGLSGATEPLELFNRIKKGVTALSGGVFQVTQQIAFFTVAFQGLRQLVSNGPFDMLIGQNVRLREELLSTQATLASTSRVFRDGFAIADPTDAIKALDGPIKEAIAKLRRDSLELVGVTSSQLVPLFQIVSQRITSIGGDLNDAVQLALDFAATMGTVALPMAQARQEINSILSGTIDMNSVIAKTLNITNAMVRRWKEQGTTIQELTKRLAGFRQGNKLAAEQLSGLTSNIMEVFELITLQAGEPLLDFILGEVQGFYDLLNRSKPQLDAFFASVVGAMTRIGAAVADTVKAIGKTLAPLGESVPILLFEVLAQIVEEVAKAVKFALVVFAPFVEILNLVAENAKALVIPMLQIFLHLKSLQIGFKLVTEGFGLFSRMIPGVGELLFLFQGRMAGIVGQFVQLNKMVGLGGAAFLTFGQHLGKFSGIYNQVANSIPIIGPMIANLIPQVATIGVAIAALSVKFPVLREVITRVALGFDQLTPKIADLAGRAGLPLLSQKITEYGTTAAIQNKITGVMQAQLAKVVPTVALMAAKLAILAGGIYLGVTAFNTFILKNERLHEVFHAITSVFSQFGEALQLSVTHPLGIAAIAVTALTTAIAIGLTPALKAVVIQLGVILVGAFTGLAAKVAILATGLLKLGVLMQGQTLLGFSLGLSLKAVGLSLAEVSIHLSTMAVAAKNGTLSLALFKTEALATGVAVGGLLKALAPLLAGIGIAIAFIGLGVFLNHVQQIKNAAQELDAFAATSARLQQNALDLSTEIFKDQERVNAAKQSGIAVTNEENTAMRKRRKQAELQIETLEIEEKLMRARIDKIHPDFRAALENEANGIKARLDQLRRLSSAINLEQIELETLGGTYEQLATRAQSALEALDTPFGDIEIFKKRTKEIIDLTNKQLKLNQITEEQAIARFKKVAENSKVEVDLQIQAIEAIASARKKAVDKENELLSAQNEFIKAQSRLGKKNAVEAELEITENKRQQIKNRVDTEKLSNQELIERENKAFEEAKTLTKKIAEEENLAIEKARKQGKEVDPATLQRIAKQNDARIQSAQARQDAISKAVELSNAKLGKLYAEDANAFLDGQKKVLDEQISALDRAQRTANDLQAQAETDRLIQVAQLREQGILDEAEANALRARETRDATREDIAQEKRRLEQLQELQKQNDPKVAAKVEADIRSSAIASRKLTLKLLNDELTLEKSITAQLIQTIDERSKAQQNAFDQTEQAFTQQAALADQASQSLTRQNRLLNARSQFVAATESLLKTELKILEDTESTEEGKKKVIEAAAKVRFNALLIEQDLERQKLKIQEQQLLIALRKEESEKRLAQLQNRLNQSNALAEQEKVNLDPDSTDTQKKAAAIAVENARLQGQIIDQQLKLIETQKDTELKLISQERERLNITQQAQRDAARLDVGKAIADQSKSDAFLKKLRNEVLKRAPLDENEIKKRVDKLSSRERRLVKETDILPKEISERFGPSASKAPERSPIIPKEIKTVPAPEKQIETVNIESPDVDLPDLPDVTIAAPEVNVNVNAPEPEQASVENTVNVTPPNTLVEQIKPLEPETVTPPSTIEPEKPVSVTIDKSESTDNPFGAAVDRFGNAVDRFGGIDAQNETPEVPTTAIAPSPDIDVNIPEPESPIVPVPRNDSRNNEAAVNPEPVKVESATDKWIRENGDRVMKGLDQPTVKVPVLQGAVPIPQVNVQSIQKAEGTQDVISAMKAIHLEERSQVQEQLRAQDKILTELQTIATKDPLVIQQKIGAAGKKVAKMARKELASLNL